DLGPQLLDHRGLLNHQCRKLLIRRPIAVHIIQFAAQRPRPTPSEQSRLAGVSSIAGAGFEPATFGL
ncbi:MAG TPA: hypothetical protein VND98_05350, partial [Solirubrobacterales bacterium]|nr:hypothetical protein [Solirubrobacterales bacterium]